jgi:hypothetical protein
MRRPVSRLCSPLGMVVAVLAAAGCHSRVEKELVPAKGKVLVGQVAPAGALVTFHPDDANGDAAGAVAMGKVRADGGYELVTGDRPGAAIGRYRVTVVALGPPGGAGADQKPPLNPRYGRLDQTDLVVEVVREPRPDQYDLHLAR